MISFLEFCPKYFDCVPDMLVLWLNLPAFSLKNQKMRRYDRILYALRSQQYMKRSRHTLEAFLGDLSILKVQI